MLGFLFGAACLLGLVKTVKYGGGYGHGGHGPWGRRGHWGRHGGGGYGRSWMLRGLFERLETSPGQEKVIREAVEQVQEAASKLRGQFDPAREAMASALRGEHFDQEKIRDVFAQNDVQIETMKKTLMDSLGKVHEALEPGQREKLAELIEDFGSFRGGHRHGHGRGSGRWGHGEGHDAANC